MTISEQLREAIQEYGSVYSVARDSGVSQAILQRFVTEKRDMYLATVDVLCEFFGMHLTQPTAKRPKPNGRKTPKRAATKPTGKGKRK